MHMAANGLVTVAEAQRNCSNYTCDNYNSNDCKTKDCYLKLLLETVQEKIKKKKKKLHKGFVSRAN